MKDIKNPNAIETSKHFNSWSHFFPKDGKFILTVQMSNMYINRGSKKAVKDRKNYWIKRLKTLTHFVLNEELN